MSDNTTLRTPADVMKLARMGAMHATRLSFMPNLVRRMARQQWRFERTHFDLDSEGFGASAFTAHTPERSYTLVAFTRPLDPSERSDRVFAEAWDATFSLYDGIPDGAEIQRLSQNTPLQEAGRFRETELVLARANKSMRLFEYIVENLAAGRQPDISRLNEVGYLMRTTAVYGNGKFGGADRMRIASRPETRVSFEVEMLAVYLIRWFTIDLIEHVARARGGENAVPLAPQLSRFLGIGNATGLGMAPFLVRHPKLLHRWCLARETALARVLQSTPGKNGELSRLQALVTRVRQHLLEWNVEDPVQQARIEVLRQEIDTLAERINHSSLGEDVRPWQTLNNFAANFSLEGQELVVSLLIEVNGELVDDLAESMYDEESWRLNPAQTVAELKQLVSRNYAWVNDFDFSTPGSSARFWYYSEDKIEPRLGDRETDSGAHLEMPLGIAHDVHQLMLALETCPSEMTMAQFCRNHPDLRHVVRRVQSLDGYPYAEIQDNLLDTDLRPIDMLRFKLAFFGASKFDPKSDLWTRITMFQGAPMPEEIQNPEVQDWAFPVKPLIAEAGA